MQRKKVNDNFSYPLELNMGAHIDPAEMHKEPSENYDYELKAILIHRGGAYGGHYHSYMQDEMKEGNWDLVMPEEFKSEPKLVEKKTFNPKEFMTKA
mmetsp:Transcript_35152/g.34171  ORF Transcript_35152/g.34171 Transcript_35152/m.34171 type:complete len:97 (+) Transcript_35152:783-1073(+)